MSQQASPVIGFGALWNRDRAATWSHIPLALLTALEGSGRVADLGYDDVRRRWGHILSHVRVRDGRLTTTWRTSPRVMEAAARSIQRAATSAEVDAVVTIADLGVFDQPTFVFQDLSYDLVDREIRSGNDQAADQFSRMTTARRLSNLERQRTIFESTTGVLAMSRWYAESLVTDSGLDPAQVHVVHPGANAAVGETRPLGERVARALFVGRDFTRKGGESAIAAVQRVREGGVDLGLTVIGPDTWPLAGDPPPWVDFAGPRPTDAVAAAMASHQVFLLPTRFEAFGIVFAEALRAGTPVVGPDRFAVPEIVTDGRDGALHADWTVDSIAAAIDRALQDDIRQGALDGVAAARRHWTWDRAAADVRQAVAVGLSSG